MIKSTLGAPLGGTTVGGQYGLESTAVSLITPPNFGSGGGICRPSIVIVALVEPGVPVICWALLGTAVNMAVKVVRRDTTMLIPVNTLVFIYSLSTEAPMLVQFLTSSDSISSLLPLSKGRNRE